MGWFFFFFFSFLVIFFYFLSGCYRLQASKESRLYGDYSTDFTAMKYRQENDERT